MYIGYIGEARRQQTDADGVIPREVGRLQKRLDPVTTEERKL